MMSKNIVCVAVFLVVIKCCSAAFTVEHVNFIQADGNYLFRGGIANNDGQFQYDTLVSELRTEAKEQGGITLPETFYLIDINLLNPNDSGDMKDITIEVDFFKSNSTLGEIIRHPTFGEKTNPFNYSSDYIKEHALTFATWSTDKLPDFIEQIRSIVTDKNNTLPTVSYIHCECGCDRTGEVSGSYYMAYMNMSLHDAHALDEKIAGREISTDNHYALNWYCFYLKYAKNYDLTCDQ